MSNEPTGPWVEPMIRAKATDPRNGRPSWNRLAELADVSTTTITQMVEGKRRTSPQTIGKIADALHVDPERVSEWIGRDQPVRRAWEPPGEVNLLTARQQKALAELIRAMAAPEREEVVGHADAETGPTPMNPAGTPPATNVRTLHTNTGVEGMPPMPDDLAAMDGEPGNPPDTTTGEHDQRGQED
ncbi:helix-turn-helix domain-containing protein [Ruania rhizosphaerae]|uniref:helix-turn-helix domain-containing protein n=1 Tax=Ruania rhizosphaerae TaxID=1840413 RepID=UPI001359241A|nr:helix-turn-helix transcriptional regulator [Ruania rhizosphaerae]